MVERMRPAIVILVMVLSTACGGSTSQTKPQVTPRKSDGAIAPRLFSLEQLRQGVPKGRVVELRIEVEGKPTIVDHWEFTAVDADGATIHSVTRDASGQILGDETGTSKWTELHDHAKFPAATTRFEDGVTLTVPAGTFKTRLYTVRPDATTVRRFWFAVDLPGPPVQFTTEKDGKVVMRAEMLRAR